MIKLYPLTPLKSGVHAQACLLNVPSVLATNLILDPALRRDERG